jgi:hypothetical protein
MSITLDDNAVDVFKTYDDLAIAYSKDIEGYKTILKSIEAMITQKEEMLQDIKNKTIGLLKSSLDIKTSPKSRVNKKSRKIKTATLNEEAAAGDEVDTGGAVYEITQSMPAEEQSQMLTPPIQVKKPKPTRQKKEAGKGNVKKVAKPKKPAKRSKIIAEDKPKNGIAALNCLYHPESPVSDKGRQLCASCKWKLINSGLRNYDKYPAVISYLKGETKKAPHLGQSMCPIHPAVPSYNQKTGLCKVCQKKAKEIGFQDRHLTEEELMVVRNPLL